MKILIVSDSHGNQDTLDQILLQNPRMDLYLHAGDSLQNPYTLKPFISVKGNCDYDINLLENIKLKTPYGFLYMQHKPYFSSNVLNDDNIKIFISGHTHIRQFKKIDNKYFINPGSIAFSRDPLGPSYCILTIDKDNVDCQFYDLLI